MAIKEEQKLRLQGVECTVVGQYQSKSNEHVKGTPIPEGTTQEK